MIKKILQNPSDKDIVDYRIEEIKFDENGEPALDKDGETIKTGRTLEWTLKAGETLEFPAYVADYLRQVYSFLVETGAENEPEKTESLTVGEVPEVTGTPEAAKPIEGSVNCKLCGAHFKNVKALGLHFAARHAEELLND